jgi:hypothetical protein
MARFYERLTPELIEFIGRQHVFFTATAAGGAGRINLSPKGMNTFRVFGDDRVGYLDLTGSGNETAAHVQVDGRMTVMFCSFDAKPLILRLYGRGSVVRPRDAAWADLLARFEPMPGMRQIVTMRVESLQTSCGFAVPEYELKRERPTLVEWAEKKGPDGVVRYWAETNQTSIDGLPTGLVE